jgi:hypothetical protein
VRISGCCATQPRDFLANCIPHRLRFFNARIFVARPHKSSQAVTLAPRDHMHVKMRHALAHNIIDGDKTSLRLHCILHGHCQHPHIQKHRFDKRWRKVRKRLAMPPGNQQAMPGEKRPMIQKNKCVFVFKHPHTIDMAFRDFAKRAFFAGLTAVTGGSAQLQIEHGSRGLRY